MREDVKLSMKDPRNLEALQAAVAWIGEENNTTLQMVNYGTQGVVYRIESAHYPFPLSIKLPIYSQDRRDGKSEELILRDGNHMAYAAYNFPEYFPHVVVCEESGRFLVREYVEGELLSKHIKQLPEKERVKLFRQVTELTATIFYAFHNHPQEPHILYDMRVGNIIYQQQTGRMAVIDCGSVRPEKKAIKKGYKPDHSDLGVDNYINLAPESLLDIRELIDRRLDFFAYGIMGYRILFGKAPYTNKEKDPEKAMERYAEEYQVAITRIRTDSVTQGLPPVLVEQLIGCLHPDVHKRFSGTLLV